MELERKQTWILPSSTLFQNNVCIIYISGLWNSLAKKSKMLSCPDKYRRSKSSCIVKNYTGLSHFHSSWLKSLLSRLRPQCVHLTSSTSLTLALWSTNLISPGGCPDSHIFLRPGQQLLLWDVRVNINVLLSFNTGHSMTCSTLTHQLGRYIWATTFLPQECHPHFSIKN